MIRGHRLPWALLTLVFVGKLALGQSDLPRCASQFAALLEKIRASGTERTESPSRLYLEPKQTVQLQAERPGQHGGKRLTLKRIGDRWASGFAPQVADPQGDPRWFTELVGTDAAEFFGFRVLDSTHAEVPDPKEFTGAIEALNEALRREGKIPIPIRFYAPESEKIVSEREYTRQWTRAAALPLGPSGNPLMHDLSFHTGAIFLPPEFVNRAREAQRFHEDFYAWLQAKHATGPPEVRKAVERVSDLLRLEDSIQIDRATGSLTPGLVAAIHESGSKSGSLTDQKLADFLPFSFSALTDEGLTPAAAFQKKIRKAWSAKNGDARQIGISPQEIARWTRLYSLPSLQVDYRKFLEEYRPRSPSENPLVRTSRGDPEEFQRFCQEITRRRELIRETALRLKRSP